MYVCVCVCVRVCVHIKGKNEEIKGSKNFKTLEHVKLS